jgi:hypothetical protein
MPPQWASLALFASYKDPCVEVDPHVGYDAAATQVAKISFTDFLIACEAANAYIHLRIR